MGEVTSISWAHHTYNPWRGCEEIAPECDNCYAREMAKRNPAVLGEWGANGARPVESASYADLPFQWDIAAQKARERRRVFCLSLGDVFEDRPDLEPLRDRLHAKIALTPHLDWLLLTKRPHVAAKYYAEPDLYTRVLRAADQLRIGSRRERLTSIGVSNPVLPLGFRNRWILVSAGSQETAEKFLPWLMVLPAAVRGVSCEPLIGPVDFERETPVETIKGTRWVQPLYAGAGNGVTGHVDWVIAGGESGNGHREMDPKWLDTIVRQCADAETPLFVKQDSGRFPGRQGRIPDATWALKQFPAPPRERP